MTAINPVLPFLCLLSSKGPLGAIWVAGYFYKRLKKRQVTDTDIITSVDKIVLEGLPSVTYRILAYLLLGIVRIYSKKVEYLFNDCHETVSDINRFSVGKKVVSFRDIVRSSPSITLPERYELDTFQLEVADCASKCNIARNEDISIQGKDVFSQYSLDKLQFEEGSSLWEDLSDAQTSQGVTMQQETWSSTQTPDKSASERETSGHTHTPPDKVFSPHRMEFNGASSPDHLKDFKTSKEKLRELRFTEEDGVDFELDVELLNMINEYQAQTTDNMDEDALKKDPIENQDYVILKEKEVPSSTEKTHDSEVANAGVTATPEFMVVPTPAKKEKIQRPCKRKCVYDEITMLDNEIMKRVIKGASGLVCKKRKAPHTVIDLWRLHRISALPNSFLEPLIPCDALEPEVICCEVMKERTEPSSSHAIEPIEITQAPVKQQDAATSSAPADSRSTIAPGTPIQCPNSARVFGSFRGADSDGEGAHSYENRRLEVSVHDGAEDSCGPSLLAEMNENEGDSQELHRNKNGELSTRTRTVARYLRRVIQRKKQEGVEGVTLLPIVKHKTKRENALLFFEILALKTGGLINVVQEKAFGDVLLQETPKLEEALKKC
uniref:Sister chromatid cohesion 1 protein 2 n=1 Tax=Chenopodium quinoa TaxID=63459 RepID=A0A803L5W9_CHEQI